MSFTQGIQSINVLAADQAVTSSVTLVDITGFTKSLQAGARIQWELEGLFSLGATGGFKFLAHSTTAPTTYNATFNIYDVTTPKAFGFGQTGEAAVQDASAVAGGYLLSAFGTVIANTATVFSLQFAQNSSTVNAITILKGMTFKIWQF